MNNSQQCPGNEQQRTEGKKKSYTFLSTQALDVREFHETWVFENRKIKSKLKNLGLGCSSICSVCLARARL